VLGAAVLAVACGSNPPAPEKGDAPSADTAAKPRPARATPSTHRELTYTAPADAGFEGFACVGVSEPTEREEWIGSWHATLEFAHHVNLWYIAPPTSVDTFCESVATFAKDGPAFVLDSAQPDSVASVPAGGAIRIPAGSRYAFDLHVLNTTTDSVTSNITVDLNLVPPSPVEVFPGTLTAENFSIDPMSQKTLSWSCDIPSDVRIAWMSSHTHGFTQSIAVEADGQEVYRSTNWSDPLARVFDPPITPGTLRWESDIVNNLPTTLEYGPSRDKNEMSDILVMTLGAREWCVQR
jgi:hypothetical protein